MTENARKTEKFQKQLLEATKDGMKDIPLWDMIRQLEACRDSEGCPDAKVKVVLPDGSRSCVGIGKIFGVSTGNGDLTVYMFPVQETVEEPDGHEKTLCKDAAAGKSCVECGEYMNCRRVGVVEALAKAANTAVKRPGGLCGKSK